MQIAAQKQDMPSDANHAKDGKLPRHDWRQNDKMAAQGEEEEGKVVKECWHADGL